MTFKLCGKLWLEPVFRNTYWIGFCFKSEFNLYIIFFGAQNNADGRLISGIALLFVQKVEVEIHLACMFWFKRTDLEIEGNQSLEAAVIKQKIHEIFFAPQRESMLSSDETKTVAEFEEELL